MSDLGNESTKATTEAVYALLLQSSDWLSVTEMVDVVIGGKQIEPSKLEDVKIEAGTGYYKTSWKTSEIKPEMAEVTMKPSTETEFSGDDAIKMQKLLDALENLDDVQEVYSNAVIDQ